MFTFEFETDDVTCAPCLKYPNVFAHITNIFGLEWLCFSQKISWSRPYVLIVYECHLYFVVLDGGYFDHCKVMIPASGAAAAFEADCAATTTTVYSNNPSLNRLTLEWQAQWDLPRDTPNIPNHVTESRPGIVSSEVVLRLTNAGKSNCVVMLCHTYTLNGAAVNQNQHCQQRLDLKYIVA